MYERLLDKELAPDARQLAEYCYPQSENFERFNSYLEELGMTQEIRFPYGNKYGWSVCHRQGKKLICDVFAEKGSFTVMIRLSTKQFAALRTNVSEETRSYFDQAYPCGEGGWIHYRVTTDEQLVDIKRIANAKLAK